LDKLKINISESPITTLNLYKKLWHYLSNTKKRQFIFLLFLIVLVSFFEVLSIGAIMPFLGVITSPEKVLASVYFRDAMQLFSIDNVRTSIFFIAALFAFLVIFTGCLRTLLLYFQTKVSFETGSDISVEVYYRTLSQPYLFHASNNTSELITGITAKAGGIVGNTLFPGLIIISSGLVLLSILGTLIYISPFVAILAIFIFGLMYYLVAKFTKPTLSEYSTRLNIYNSKKLKSLQEGFGGIRDVLLEGSQIIRVKQFKEIDEHIRNALSSMHIISTAPKYAIEAIGMIFIVGIVVYQSYKEVGIDEWIPVLAVFAMSAQRILPLLQQMYSGWSAIKGGKDSAEDVLRLLNLEVLQSPSFNQVEPLQFHKQLRIENVSFGYQAGYLNTIKDLSFTFEKGKRYGIIGETGSGKSTFVDLIMGVISPSAGEIYVDDIKITQQNSARWMRRVAHVPQHVFLLDASIAENIALGVATEKIDNDRLNLAIEGAQLTSVLANLPNGYNTPIGERGIRLSGGQQQRIGIARALYRDADFLVFDEATSALDSQTESAIMHAINSLASDLTILIIAHRLSTLKGCDSIIELNNGSITRIAKYSEII
jgi:ATP-binding cassette subfamily B protein